MEGSATRSAPYGLQDILNRLAVVAMANKPVCFYECFAEALERDLIRRSLLELQAEQCTFNVVLRFDSLFRANGHRPIQFSCLLFTEQQPTVYTRYTNLLSVPRVRTAFASRGFSVAASTVWNSLPSGIRDSSSTHTFRRLVKTLCFQQAFGSP